MIDAKNLSQQTTIWPEICVSLVDQFDILNAYDLRCYDSNMFDLWRQLYQHRSREFLVDQRLMFVLYDTEYCLADTKLGFTIENWIRILEDLDISLCHCILMTNHHGIKKLIADRTITEWGINVVENNYSTHQTLANPAPIKRSPQSINSHFCFMSYTRRTHRSLIRLWLHWHDLEKTTIMAWAPDAKKSEFDNQVRITSGLEKIPEPTCQLVHVSPPTRIRDKIWPNDSLRYLYQHAEVLDRSWRDQRISTDPDFTNYFYVPHISESFINISAETAFDYPYPYLTEKTFKCFWHLSPFIIVGAAGSLVYLKSIGFKTFDQWIDESYDTIQDPQKRFIAITTELEKISKWSIEQCQEVYNNMIPVLEHNLQHYSEFYCKDLLQQKIKELTT